MSKIDNPEPSNQLSTILAWAKSSSELIAGQNGFVRKDNQIPQPQSKFLVWVE